MQYIDAHPELAEQGFQIRNAVDVSCSQKKVWYTRQDASACAVAPAAADDRRTSSPPAAPTALQYKANAKTWLDTRVRRPGRRRRRLPGPAAATSTLNDGGGGKASFGRRDTPGARPPASRR